MKTPRDLSGEDLVRHLVRYWQYEVIRQRGSHIRVRTLTPAPLSTTIPAHKPIADGTLKSIIEEIAAHKRITVEALLEHL